jgi:hypothetical protein
MANSREMWELAVYTTFQRIGVMPFHKRGQMKTALNHLNPEEARKARRKYRKAWRRELVCVIKKFDSIPTIKEQERVCVDWSFTCYDGIDGVLDLLKNLCVGAKPDKKARNARLHMVRFGDRFSTEFKKVAIELGLMRRREEFVVGKKRH